MIAKEISSLQHPLVKHWAELRASSAYRHREKSLLVTGENLLSELGSFTRLIVQKGTPLPAALQAEEIYYVTEAIQKKITGLVQPEEITAEIALPAPGDLTKTERLLVLDRISDPGNLGTLLRTAQGLGWEGVFILAGSADPFNDKAMRASKGAVFRLPIMKGSEKDLEALIACKRWKIYGADGRGEPVQENFSYPSPCMLILGNEANGLSAFSREKSSLLSLPMHKELDSFNVAVAGSILMYLMRKRS